MARSPMEVSLHKSPMDIVYATAHPLSSPPSGGSQDVVDDAAATQVRKGLRRPEEGEVAKPPFPSESIGATPLPPEERGSAVMEGTSQEAASTRYRERPPALDRGDMTQEANTPNNNKKKGELKLDLS